MAKLTPPLNNNDHVQGYADAAIALVEYGDFQCPHCAMAHPVIKQLQEMHGKLLLFAFRHFPLASAHAMALPAAIAAEASGKQNKFWEMHDLIIENQELLSPHGLLEFAGILHLKIPAYQTNLQDDALTAKVEADFESGVRSGVNGTPSFFINGSKYNGSYDFVSLSRAIEQFIPA